MNQNIGVTRSINPILQEKGAPNDIIYCFKKEERKERREGKEESPTHKGTVTMKNKKKFLKTLKRKQSLELAVYKSDCYQ